jgi:hypothetical protein
MTRRDWFYLAGQTALRAQDNLHADPQRRIAQIIRAYEDQGFHRTATNVDRISGDWLATEVRQSGLTPAREIFPITRVDPTKASLSADGRRIEGVMLFGGFSDVDGVSGRLGPLQSDAQIGLTEIAPNAAGIGPLAEARRQNRQRAIVVVARGGRPGLCPSHTESFLHPFGPPVLQVSSEEADALADFARRNSDVTLIARVKRTPLDLWRDRRNTG